MLKVCGLTNLQNMHEVSESGADMIGLNFYPSSIRYCGTMLPAAVIEATQKVLRAGVFVNEQAEEVLRIADDFKLDYIQLHGNETEEYCRQLSGHFKLIKALRPDARMDQIEAYARHAEYILFDAPSENWGGTGKTIDHRFLADVDIGKKVLLAGGVDITVMEHVSRQNYSCLAGFDINSKVEVSPGIKDLNKIKHIIQYLKK